MARVSGWVLRRDLDVRDGTPGGPALLFPEYGAPRVVVSSGFATDFQAWGELASRWQG